MNTLSVLVEAIYVQVAGGRALPLIAAACPLPAAGRRRLVAPEGQSEIEFCLLSGHVDHASEGEHLGRWRVYGLSSVTRGKWEAEVRVLVGVTGEVQVAAALGPRSLHVVPLTGRASAPTASWQLPSEGPLTAAQEHARTGDLAGARGKLGHLLRANPRDTLAWALLASLLDDSARQADCYRQILRIDPADERAAAIVRALERRPQTVETTVVEARDQRPWETDPAPVEETLDELRELLRTKGIRNVNTGILRALAERRRAARDQGQERPPATVESGTSEAVNEIMRRLEDGPLTQVHAAIEGTIDAGEQSWPLQTQLTPEELVRLAGSPLPPQERIKCPECGTLVSRSRARCSWCGTSLSQA